MSSESAERDLTWSSQMGITIVKAGADEVIAELEVKPQHCQAVGLVHGGVHCGLIESAASFGASLVAKARGQAPPLGLENHTSFVRGASEGRIRAIATPITRGRTTQLWEATVKNERGEILATGRVRFLSSAEGRSGKPA